MLTKNSSYNKFNNIENIKLFLNTFFKKMDLLTTLKENEEVDIINDNIDRTWCLPILKPLYNFFTDNNIDSLFKFIDENFTVYFKVLDNLLKNRRDTPTIIDLLTKCDEFNKSICVGLINLKQTYSYSENFQFKIESILLTFKDFQDFKDNYINELKSDEDIVGFYHEI